MVTIETQDEQIVSLLDPLLSPKENNLYLSNYLGSSANFCLQSGFDYKQFDVMTRSNLMQQLEEFNPNEYVLER